MYLYSKPLVLRDDRFMKRLRYGPGARQQGGGGGWCQGGDGGEEEGREGEARPRLA